MPTLNPICVRIPRVEKSSPPSSGYGGVPSNPATVLSRGLLPLQGPQSLPLQHFSVGLP